MRSALTTVALALLAWVASLPAAEEDVAGILKALKRDANTPAARTAWEQLAAQGPGALPAILEALDTPDTVYANWLRTAFDRIVETELKNGGKKIDAGALLAFAKDPKRQGRARRLALEVAERLHPGTSERLVAGWLDDPEFGHDSIAAVLKDAEALEKKGRREEAKAMLQKAFAASRDLQQVKTLAARLRNLDAAVSVAEHLGFLTEWYAIGPFDAAGMKGFKTVYPPEKKIDFTEEMDGKKGKLRWKQFRVQEPAPASLPPAGVLVNLREPLGDAEDAVAYACTKFDVPAERTVEFRGAGDDNLTVWVNGERVFGFEEYRNGVRFDRHRFRVKLKAGVNMVLVKVCQAPSDAGNREPNWEFLLRVVDEKGKGLVFKSALPAEKK